MKPICITPHANERINARQLNSKLVNATVCNPEQIVADEDNINRQIYQSVFKDKKGKLKLLRVVVEETEEEIIVITVYPTSQIKKYWRINNEF